MNDWQKQVSEFHKVINQPTSPHVPQMLDPILRARLIAEEAIETVFALVGRRVGYNLIQDVLQKVLQKMMQDKATDQPDLLDALDGLCDTIVVCLGTAEDIGVDLSPFFDEVMRANMAKVGGPVDEFGKRGKPVGWTPPNLKAVLQRLIAAQHAKDMHP